MICYPINILRVSPKKVIEEFEGFNGGKEGGEGFKCKVIENDREVERQVADREEGDKRGVLGEVKDGLGDLGGLFVIVDREFLEFQEVVGEGDKEVEG